MSVRSQNPRWSKFLGMVAGTLGAGLGVLAVIVSIAAILNGALRNVGHQQRWNRSTDEIFSAAPGDARPEEFLTNFTSNLPVMVLRAAGRSSSSQRFGRAELFDVVGGRSSTTGQPAYSGLISMHVRGSTTRHQPKHSYTFHTLDEETNQTKVALLGLPKDDDWILYAPFEDKTMIRDVLAYELSRRMGQYAPRTRYIELFIAKNQNGITMKDYAGVYVLMEKIKRSSERVNIAKLKEDQETEPEISGGYIVKRDHGEGGGGRFHTDHGGPYFYVYPDADRITARQKAWLKGYFQSFEQALYGGNFKDPKKGYNAYLDVDGFIDQHWLIEMSKNVDGFRYSAYITKDRNGKLNPGPAWDWNRSFGNANYYGGDRVRGWYWSNLRPNEISWYERLREDPAFLERCRTRWLALRKDVVDPKKVSALIDEYAAQLDEAQKRNFKRWSILGDQLGPNSYVGDSYEDEVKWLKKWVEGRIAWIDGQVSKRDI